MQKKCPNTITLQSSAFGRERSHEACWCPVSFPLKPFVCSLKAEAPNPSSPSPSICQSTQWHWPGKCMQNWVGDVDGPLESGVLGHARPQSTAWVCLSNVTHLTIKVREQSLLLLAFSGIYLKISFLLPPLPSVLSQTCPQGNEWFFLNAIMKNSFSQSKSILLWANSPHFSSFSCLFLLLAEAAILLDFQ